MNKMQELNESYEVLKSKISAPSSKSQSGFPKGLTKIFNQLEKMWTAVADDEKIVLADMWKQYTSSGEFKDDLADFLQSKYLSVVHSVITATLITVVFSIIGFLTVFVWILRLMLVFFRLSLWLLRRIFSLIYGIFFGSNAATKTLSGCESAAASKVS